MAGGCHEPDASEAHADAGQLSVNWACHVHFGRPNSTFQFPSNSPPVCMEDLTERASNFLGFPKQLAMIKQFTILITLLFFISLGKLGASCPTGDITLNSQASIDNFSTTYSGCTVMPYSITIFESVMGNIVNLDGLSVLTEIQGSLLIISNDALDDLTGLSNVTTIGGELIVEDNSALTNLNGLGTITGAIGSVSIGSNPMLADISALSGLSSLNGPLNISFNDVLIDLTGLGGISTVTSYVRISHNNSLTSIAGLDGLTAVDDYFQIEWNPALSSITGMNALATVGGSVEIWNNFHLASISGFSSLNSIPSRLYIYLNHDLTSISGFANLGSIDGSLEIQVNVSLLGITGLGSLSTIGGDLRIAGNSNLMSMSGLASLGAVGNRAAISGNNDLMDLTGLAGLTTVGEDLEIIGNNNLASLSGLGGLANIGGNLKIQTNFLLTDLTALSGLNTINGGSLTIQNNETLPSLNGLGNIAHASISNLTVSNNMLLSQCEVQSVCDYLSNPGNPANISGNASGCNDRTEVETACGFVLPVELASFKATQAGKSVKLLWSTKSELDNAYFEVEKSDDGWHWVGVGRVEGRGMKSEATNYDLLDNHPFPGINYYRLRQVDIDGKEEYSEVISIDLRNLEDFGNLRLAPNPATTHLQLSNVELADFDYLQVTDQHGRQVLMTHDLASSLEIEYLEPGIYHLQLNGASTIQTLRFVKN